MEYDFAKIIKGHGYGNPPLCISNVADRIILVLRNTYTGKGWNFQFKKISGDTYKIKLSK